MWGTPAYGETAVRRQDGWDENPAAGVQPEKVMIRKFPIIYVHYRSYKSPPLNSPEPDDSSPYPHTRFILKSILILPSHLRLGPFCVSSIQILRLKFRRHVHFSPPHPPPPMRVTSLKSLSLIWSSELVFRI
jgi:hypothetical protein